MMPFDNRTLRTCGACLVVLLAACGGKTPGPPPTPVTDPPQIACPADMSVGGITGGSQAVTFPNPTVTAGTAPVTTACNPASGGSFPLGSTSVSCMATDASARVASCSFTVTVTGLVLGVKRFAAYGDSLTAGENGVGIRPSVVDPGNSYPTKLLAALEATYPGQGIVVINRGEPGKKVYETEEKLPGFLLADRPEAVLLLSGYNDLTDPCGAGHVTLLCGEAITHVAVGVRDLIRRSKESPVGVKFIFVSTLTPPGPSGGQRIDDDTIRETNRKIRQMVASEKATLVDTYPLFAGHEAEYVSVDGLHLRPAGYQAIADAFFTAIKATVPQTSLASTGTIR
jgi:lysophospholipase L1-like esterase